MIILLWCAGILTSIPIIVRTKVSSVGNDSRNDYCGINWEGSRCSRALSSVQNISTDIEIIENRVLEEDVGCWSLGKCSFTQEEQMYRINLLIWTFCLPMTAIVICYWKVYRLVYRFRAVSFFYLTSRTVKLSAIRMAKSINGSKRTRRIQMMVSLLIIVYIVLWSPYHIYTILGM